MTFASDGELSLRVMTVADAASVQRCRNHPDVVRYQSWRPATVAEVEALARDQEGRTPGMPGAIGDGNLGGFCQVSIAHSQCEGVGVVGDLGVHVPDELGALELGAVLHPDWQGRGVATAALRLMLDFLFRDGSPARRVLGRVDPRNSKSLALLGRLGFRKEGYEVECYWDEDDGAWTDEVCFALLRREWLAARPQ